MSDEKEVPFEGGSQPVPEHPTPPPAEGRSVMQFVVIGLGVLVVLAGILWLLVPILSG